MIEESAPRSLWESEPTHRDLLARVPAIVCELAADGATMFINRAAAAIIGYQPEELRDRNFWDLLFPGEQRRQIEDLHQKLRSGDVADYELVLTARDGSAKTLLWTFANQRAPDGTLQSIAGFGMDITERKRVDENLAQQVRLAALTADVSVALVRSGDLRDALRDCAEALVRHLDVALARIWTLNKEHNVLDLQVSVGMDSRIDGLHSRVPLGEFITGTIAQERRPHLTNDLLRDPLLRDPEWVDRQQMVAFAGYPLIVDDRLVGVMAVFSRKPVTELTIQAMASVANGIALGVERKRAEEALRASESKYRSLFDNNLNGLAYQKVLFDEENRPIDYVFLEVNDAFEKLTGCKRGHMIGRRVTELMSESDESVIDLIDNYGRVALTGKGIRFEKYVEQLDFWYAVSVYSPARGYFVTQYTDISERKRAEEELLRLRKAVESSGEVVFLTDREGIFTYVNPEFSRVYGFSAEEVVGKKTPRVLKSGTMQLKDYAMFWNLLLSGQTPRGEFVNRTKDGQLLHVEGSANPVTDERRGIVGFLAIQRDITERKVAEQALRESLEKLRRTMEGTIHAMALTVEMRDPYTAGHQQRVARLASAVAETMGLSKEQIDVIRFAGIVHDIGKISVPAEILNKPGRLSPIEFNLVKAHPQIGCEILSTIEFPWPIARIVLQHHETMDGSGYPSGLKGEDILLEARILGVADVVEAMASHRPYRPALGISEALEEVSKNNGTLYDPQVIEACLRLFRKQGFELGQEVGVVASSR